MEYLSGQGKIAMTGRSERKRIEELFEAAISRPAADRERFIAEAAGDETALAREVLELVAADLEAGEYVGGIRAESEPVAGERTGAYRLVRLLGVGGMGTVWLAERDDEAYAAEVAIKFIKRGMDSNEVLLRFKQERQLLANLEHPQIARILDGGLTAGGQPYMVMEYVDGQPIDTYCIERSLTVRARLDLFLAVCGAVQHAHNNLVVHRDLKPGNILVTAAGVPKLLDFGIAKVLDPAAGQPDLTMAAARLLSPRYASPEQLRGDNITTGSDVYSLGLVLFELLTEESPYPVTDSSLYTIQKHVLEHEPTRPSLVVMTNRLARGESSAEARALRRRLNGDLDTIVLKALRKEPERRYGSVDQLAADIRRHLDGLPVLARGASVRYRTTRFLQRHTVAVMAAVVVAAALVAATVISSSLYLRANVATRQAAAERHVAQQVSGFLEEMLGSIDPEVARGRDTELLSEILDQASVRIDDELGDAPQVAAALHHTLGTTKLILAETAAAESHLRRAVALRRDQFSDENTESALALVLSLRDLGHAVHESGHYTDAEIILREALEIGEAHLGVDALDLALIRYRLGLSLEASGGYSEAESLLRRAMAVLRRQGQPAVRIMALDGLGSFIMYNNQAYTEAESLFTEALRLSRREPTAGVLAEADCLQSLATAKRYQGQNQAAETHYRRALAAGEAILPARHPILANWKSQLATLLENQKRYDEAESLYREALAIQRDVLGENHRNVGTTANNLAGALRKAGRYAEAEPFFKEAVRIYRSALGDEHAWVAIVLANLAYNQILNHDHTAAAATAQECLQVSAQHWPPEHWRIAAVETIEGACLGARGDFTGGEAILVSSLAKLENGEGTPEARTRFAREQLADLYRRWGKLERAALLEDPQKKNR